MTKATRDQLEALINKVVGERATVRLRTKPREQAALQHVRELRMSKRLADHGMRGRQIGRILHRAAKHGLRHGDAGIAAALKACKPFGVGGERVVPPNSIIPPPDGWIDEAEAARWNLWHKRTQQMRREARAGYAAMAFLRGRPFKAEYDSATGKWNGGVECMSYEPPPWDRVADIVRQFTPEDPRVAVQHLQEWIHDSGWVKRDVLRTAPYGKKESTGLHWRHRDDDHESYTHKLDPKWKHAV